MQKKRARLLTIVMAVALGVLLIATQFDQQVHYVNPGTLNHHFFWRRGWYYDGTDWAYVRGGRKVTGSQKINGVQYHFRADGRQYELTSSQGSNQRATPKYIILHDVGSRATGQQAASFMQRTANSNQAYTNFIVGNGGTVYLMKQPGTVSWGAGTTANQNAPVQIELGQTSSVATFRRDYQAYVALARDMAGKYNIPLTLDQGRAGTKGIKSHRWVSQHIWGDHQDPYEYLARFGVTKQELVDDLAG
ncbi:N-acetylmuramoyl-L-alanine amidase [Limosilactobacillus oris]|uniref:N-acetylmuramoyl-L-alanine amidase n=1 Tax=Limosilactobacillus oris TaxID=1632 RepID=UPI0022E3B5CE|nr:N-acetylmuramoyl-L-alanine amidase [Limosilactobacillus oris]